MRSVSPGERLVDLESQIEYSQRETGNRWKLQGAFTHPVDSYKLISRYRVGDPLIYVVLCAP